ALYLTAFALGILSVYPTLLLITLEETVFKLHPMGQPIPDAIYFVFGVGLREELSKFLLFLPLLPWLNRRGSRIEALTCGAMVGLGFAAEENIGYFHSMDMSAALGRFLTANFLHMALTALVAVAAYDISKSRRRPSGDLNVTFLIVIGIHGAYDFFLSSNFIGGSSILAMILFILIAQRFLRELLFAAPDAQREGLLQLFVFSLATLTGLSYVYATTLVGPWNAILVIGTGSIGVAIMIIMFVYELGT
ncbi:MAG: PrsW family glutamic-type intramembrane protease, partial [Thermoanaerobaculia bacterium]